MTVFHPAEYESPQPWRGAEKPRSWNVDSDAAKLSLNGDWRFRFSPSVPAAGDESFTAPTFDDAKWDTIPVPSTWVLEGNGKYGNPEYQNINYPFVVDPPHVPDANPTGDYRVTFDLPAGWDLADGKSLIRFDGVESWAKVFVNGTELGYSTGSRLPVEFDATATLKATGNVLAVRVHQWSAATYLEDQDQW